MKAAFVVIVLGLFPSSLLIAQAPTVEQVQCETRQLANLAARVGAADTAFLWRGGTGGGSYRGLVVRDPFRNSTPSQPTRFEYQMTFDLVFEQSADRLGPDRTLLPQATLVRRDGGTTLLPNPPPNELNIVGLGIELGLYFRGLPFPGGQKLLLTNVANDPFLRVSGAGWGIIQDDFQDNLVRSCHPFVSERDLRIYQILARTMRIDTCDDQGLGCGNPQPLQIALYRATEPDTYLVDIYSFNQETNPSLGAIPLGLTFERDALGRLTVGMAKVLVEGCTPQVCSTPGPPANIFFLPPLTPGRDRQGREVISNAPRLNVSLFGSDNIPETTIDWAALLAGTVYNENWP